MDCVFSNPVDYQGNPPTTDLTSFQFTQAHCSTPSAQTTSTASISAVSFTPDVNQAITNQNFMVFLGFCILILLFSIFISHELLSKRP